jgi:hypothetical protein
LFERLHNEGMGSGGWGRHEARRSADAFRAARASDRARAARLDRPDRSDRSGEGDRRRMPPRHCWVTDPPAAPGRWPGVVVGWRTVDGRWEGRVVVVVGSGADAGVLDLWLGEDQLAPA